MKNVEAVKWKTATNASIVSICASMVAQEGLESFVLAAHAQIWYVQGHTYTQINTYTHAHTLTIVQQAKNHCFNQLMLT